MGWSVEWCYIWRWGVLFCRVMLWGDVRWQCMKHRLGEWWSNLGWLGGVTLRVCVIASKRHGYTQHCSFVWNSVTPDYAWLDLFANPNWICTYVALAQDTYTTLTSLHDTSWIANVCACIHIHEVVRFTSPCQLSNPCSFPTCAAAACNWGRQRLATREMPMRSTWSKRRSRRLLLHPAMRSPWTMRWWMTLSRWFDAADVCSPLEAWYNENTSSVT